MRPVLTLRSTPSRLVAATIAFAVIGLSCASDSLVDRGLFAGAADGGVTATDATDDTGTVSSPGGTNAAAPAAPLPGDAAAPPSAGAPATTVPESVPVYQPDLLVRPDDPAAADLHSAVAIEGVEHLAGVARFDATIVLPEGRSETISVVAVDPSTFRSVTPSITALEPAVWQRISEGEVAVRHEIAHRLQLELGGQIVLSSLARGTTLNVRLGALASNGAPPLADVVVPWDVGVNLADARTNLLVVAVAEGVAAPTVGDRIAEALGGAVVEPLEAPEEREAALQGGGAAQQFQPFSYLDLGDGLLIIDPHWVSHWIVTVDLPGLGRTRCHRLMVPQLLAAIDEIHREGLAGHFKPEQFAGCWVPRHIDWDPRKPISMHAWGLAVDINSQENWLGNVPRMDMRIVEIFEKWGFEWGGRWSRPDGMHFELKRLVQPG